MFPTFLKLQETFSFFHHDTTTHCHEPESHGRLVQVKVKDQMTIKIQHALPLKAIIIGESHEDRRIIFHRSLKPYLYGRFIDFASPLLRAFCDN